MGNKLIATSLPVALSLRQTQTKPNRTKTNRVLPASSVSYVLAIKPHKCHTRIFHPPHQPSPYVTSRLQRQGQQLLHHSVHHLRRLVLGQTIRGAKHTHVQAIITLHGYLHVKRRLHTTLY